MSKPNSPTSDQIEQIQKSMQRIRCELDADFKQVKASASRMTDWQHYVKRYPWISMGAASLLGCLLVPKKKEYQSHLDSDSLNKIISALSSRNESRSAKNTKDAQEEEVEDAETSGYLKGMLTMAASMALRAGTTHIMNKYLGDSKASLWNALSGSSGKSTATQAPANADYVDERSI